MIPRRMAWSLLALAAGAGVAGAAEGGGAPRVFHVDAAKGDDAKDGLAPDSAWRSLGRVNGAALRPGDKVLFRRGGAWRGQLVPVSGDASGVVTYGAYGEGEKPLLLGSAALDRPEDWQPAGPDLWATVPLRFEPGAALADLRQARWGLHQEGGAACRLVPIPAGGEGYPGYRLECDQPGTAPNHIQLSVPGLSVREGEYCLLQLRARCTPPAKPCRAVLMKDGPPWTAYAEPDAPFVPVAAWGAQTIRFHARHTAADARLTLFMGGALPPGSTLLLQPGTLVSAACSQPVPLSVDVGNIIFDHGASTGVKKWGVADLKQEGDYFYDARAWQVTLRSAGNPATRHRSIELALNRHIIDEGGRGYVTYDNLALRYGAAHGVGGGGTHHITVRDCDLSYIGGGHQMTRPDGTPVRFGNGVEFWMFYDNSSATEGVVVRYNIFCDAKDSLLRLHGRDWTAALAMDSNCWFQREGPMLLWGRETAGADRFAAFLQPRGLEAHGIVADPKFVDPARNDYRLAPDSPARAISDGGLPPGALP